MSDSGYGHEDIPCMTYYILVDIFTLMCVGLIIACALRWRVMLVGDYHYWAFLTPLWDPHFQVHEKTALLRGLEYEDGRVVALRSIFVKYIRII